MPGLHIPSREQRLLDLYSKDFILLFEYESFVRGVNFEKESFNFNLALSRMTMRFADVFRHHALYPRLKGVCSKMLVQNAWIWSKSVEALRALSAERMQVTVLGGAALRLASLEGMPRKLGTVEVFADPLMPAKLRKTVTQSGLINVKKSLFRVRTMTEIVKDGLEEFHDPSGISLLIPSVELQFLMLCANSIFSLDGNVFDDSCLQWVMDAVDMVRLHPRMSWETVAHLASVHGQNAALSRAMEILRETVPSIFAGIPLAAASPSPIEETAMRRHSRFLEMDAECRDNASKGGFIAQCRRPFLRLMSNHYDFSRYHPTRNLPGLLCLAPGYYYKKYYLKQGRRSSE